MAYTRPAFDAAHASWAGAAVYTRPAFDAAHASFYVAPVSGSEGFLVDGGLPLPATVLGVLPRVGWIIDDGLPAPIVASGYSGSAGPIVASTPLGVAAMLGYSRPTGSIVDGGLPVPPRMQAFFDPLPYMDASAPDRFAMDLFVGADRVRVPISSWQGTLQVGAQSYLSCVVPACGPWLNLIQSATEFSISRVGRYRDGTVADVFIARAPVQTVTIDQGPVNHTASISGYFAPYPALVSPLDIFDTRLAGVQTVSTYGGGVRIRCAINWLLRPGQRAIWGALSFPVSFINFYAGGAGSYMDVGYRVVN